MMPGMFRLHFGKIGVLLQKAAHFGATAAHGDMGSVAGKKILRRQTYFKIANFDFVLKSVEHRAFKIFCGPSDFIGDKEYLFKVVHTRLVGGGQLANTVAEHDVRLVTPALPDVGQTDSCRNGYQWAVRTAVHILVIGPDFLQIDA